MQIWVNCAAFTGDDADLVCCYSRTFGTEEGGQAWKWFGSVLAKMVGLCQTDNPLLSTVCYSQTLRVDMIIKKEQWVRALN